ncbi:MAG: HNH endonuclease [Oscillospiraceae bacterium]|nr:HNH endonuclease [Oscillospiraceae bacterium]
MSKEPNAICEKCGKPFHARKGSRFCCWDCFNESRKRRAEFQCTNCGKTVEKPISQSKWETHFCSMACYSEWKAKSENGGWTIESREKASASRKKIVRSAGKDAYKRHLGKRIHREVAEKMIGRPLQPGEVVHHINGDKHDNRPENLMIFASQQEHVAYHAAHPDESGVQLGKRGDA